MPEGPSILLASEAMQKFSGGKVASVKGNAKIDLARLKGRQLLAVRTWGKHLLLVFDGFFLRIHFLMFGSYLIGERKKTAPRLSLKFKKVELNFYTCSIRLIDSTPEAIYDFSTDVLSSDWNPRKARAKLNKKKDQLVCDVLLDQDMFSGVGNIIKNEVLFRIRLDPRTLVGTIPAQIKSNLVREARNYSLDFLEWKRAYVLKKNYQVYTKKICPRDKHSIRKEYLGITRRRTYYCPHCQRLYG